MLGSEKMSEDTIYEVKIPSEKFKKIIDALKSEFDYQHEHSIYFEPEDKILGISAEDTTDMSDSFVIEISTKKVEISKCSYDSTGYILTYFLEKHNLNEILDMIPDLILHNRETITPDESEVMW